MADCRGFMLTVWLYVAIAVPKRCGPLNGKNGGTKSLREISTHRRSNVDRAEPLSASVKMTRVRVLEITHLRFGKAMRHNLSIIQKIRIASTK
jgi:hypothetical protein